MPENHLNMFGGSPLNRFSWLRTSHVFLNAKVESPKTKWLLFNAGQCLVVSNAPSKFSPVFLRTGDVKPLLGAAPYFGQGKEVGVLVSATECARKHSPTEAARHHNPPIVFLGIDETSVTCNTLPTKDVQDPHTAVVPTDGTPYFAMDVADLGWNADRLDELLKSSTAGKERQAMTWSDPKVLKSGMDYFTAAVFATARSLSDWNYRNKFCPACGSSTYSMLGGWKIACRTLLPWADNSDRKPCPSGMGINNYTYPRTDGVVILLAVDETGERVLLGRNKRFPEKYYSALAGFIEPGESTEDAIRREMWEEVGITVSNIQYHSSQPWPYPSTLMIGFYARADSSQPIRTDLDNELAEARWFSRDEILSLLGLKRGISSDDEEGNNRTSRAASGAFWPDAMPANDASSKADDLPFRLPPDTAIAMVLLRTWATGQVVFGPPSVKVSL